MIIVDDKLALWQRGRLLIFVECMSLFHFPEHSFQEADTEYFRRNDLTLSHSRGKQTFFSTLADLRVYRLRIDYSPFRASWAGAAEMVRQREK
jgi:hypothetical protein